MIKQYLFFVMVILLSAACKQSYKPKNPVNSDKYTAISGKYDFEFNSAGVSFASVNIKYLGNKKFTFEISTAHKSDCTGELSGTAIFDSNGIGHYTGSECKLISFNFSNKKLIISETDCQHHHGVRCWFSGTYIKTE